MNNKLKVKTISCLSTLIWMCVYIFFIIQSENIGILTSIAIVHASIVSAWLGFDVAKVRQRSHQLPKGSAENVKLFRYVVCAISSATLLIVTIVFYGYDDYIGGVYEILISSSGAPFILLVMSLNFSKNGRMISSSFENPKNYSQNSSYEEGL